MSEQSQPAGSGPAGPEEDSASSSVAPRRRGNSRGAQIGAALTSRSAGWIVAAALAGSLATYLFAPPRTTPAASVGIAYRSASPVTGHRGARVVGPGGSARVQVPASVSVPPGVSVQQQRRIASGWVQVVLPPGNVSAPLPPGVVVPGPQHVYFAKPRTLHGRVQVVLPGGIASGPAAGQMVAGPGGNWVVAPGPGCAVGGPGGLPWGHRMSVRLARPGALKRIVSVHGRRASINWVQVPAPQRVVIVRPPVAKRITVGPGRGTRRVYIVRPGGPRVVIVGPGRRSVRAPRQIRLWLRSGKRLTVVRGGVIAPAPGPACVMVRPPR